MTIYLDLDGPLLDTAHRYHRTYRWIVEQFGCPPLDLETYWGLKRAGRRETEICGTWHPSIDAGEYLNLFLARIETPCLLAEDRVVPGALETLAELGSSHRLVVATLRRKGGPLREQLRTLGLLDRFETLLQHEDNDGGWPNKARMVAEETGFSRIGSILVGDTEGDILAASRAGIPSAAVCNGLRSRETLAAYSPQHLMPTIRDLPSIVPGLRHMPETTAAQRRQEAG